MLLLTGFGIFPLENQLLFHQPYLTCWFYNQEQLEYKCTYMWKHWCITCSYSIWDSLLFYFYLLNPNPGALSNNYCMNLISMLYLLRITSNFQVLVFDYSGSFHNLSPQEIDTILTHSNLEECILSIDSSLSRALEINMKLKKTRAQRDLGELHVHVHSALVWMISLGGGG